jgi:hypothetical protein
VNFLKQRLSLKRSLRSSNWWTRKRR